MTRLFDSELQQIAGARELLAQVTVPVCTVSNGPVSKMRHSLGLTGMLPYFDDRLFSGYDIQRWKPDPAIVFHAAERMQVPVTRCITVDDSPAGAGPVSTPAFRSFTSAPTRIIRRSTTRW